MAEDILSKIHNRLPRLTKGQKKIGEYVLRELEQAAFLTAINLGRAVQVSESTVVRFATELGYEGYPQMQKAMQECVLSRLTSVQRMDAAHRQMEDEDPVTSMLQRDMEALAQSSELLDRRAFWGAVETLLSARRIYVIGLRSCEAPAIFLYHYLNYMFDDVRLIAHNAESDVFAHLVRVGPQDAVLGISFPRYASATVQALRYCKEAGAHTVALTDSGSAPLAPWADHCLTVKSTMASMVDSMTAPMSVINALLTALAARRKEETVKTFDKMEEIWDMYHVYEKIGD